MTNFKLDDWVRVIEGHAKNKVFKVTGLLGTDVLLGNCFNYKADHCELWQPKPKEWCWFWNRDKTNKPKLKQLYSINYEHDVHWTYKTIDCKTYQHCEPFIGQLPTHLKDN